MTVSEEIKSKQTVRSVLEGCGVSILVGRGKNDSCLCPFHSDKKPSLDIAKDADIWICRAGCGGGDVVDLLAKFDGKTASEYLRTLSKDRPKSNEDRPRTHFSEKKVSTYVKPQSTPQIENPFADPNPDPVIVKAYPYHDANGKLIYEAVRYEPKNFKQRAVRPDGCYSWSMDGVERVLYALPEVRRATEVWVVEGEKDADTLRAAGLVATTNVGGAGKWLDSYNEHLIGKDIIICGDNDLPGKPPAGSEHVNMVRTSLEPVARTIRIVKVPAPAKDISEHTEGMSDAELLSECLRLRDAVEPLYKGEPLPLKSMADLEKLYLESMHRDTANCLHLGRWMSLLQEAVLVPGEVVSIIAETGVGKTSLLTNIALSHPHLATLYFHLELSDRKAFERTLQSGTGHSRKTIQEVYMRRDRIDFSQSGLDHVLFCTEAVTLKALESILRRSELKFGRKPNLVLIDYIQLIRGEGKQSRYERFTDIAEGLKYLAKKYNVIIVLASQVNRDKERAFGEMSINDAKDSGAIENSSTLLLGASRNPDKKSEMCLQVLKGSEIGSGLKILCKYDFETLRITQIEPFIRNS
jgi:hypothetical protein